MTANARIERAHARITAPAKQSRAAVTLSNNAAPCHETGENGQGSYKQLQRPAHNGIVILQNRGQVIVTILDIGSAYGCHKLGLLVQQCYVPLHDWHKYRRTIVQAYCRPVVDCHTYRRTIQAIDKLGSWFGHVPSGCLI
jgi:hypothetical protein